VLGKMAARIALMLEEGGQCSYFIMPAFAEFLLLSLESRKDNTIPVFLLHLGHLLSPLDTEKSKKFNQ
jgi:hypothetical protein